MLYSKEEIARKVWEVANQISKDYYSKELVLLGILKGSFIFLADLVRNLHIPLEIDFVGLASYGSQSQSSKEIKITKDIELPIEGKDVVVVEDVIDSGLTVSFLMEMVRAKKPNSLRLCVLVDKGERREVEIRADYTGFRLERGFIVGYGLDLDEKYRHLPDIYTVIDNC